MLFFANPRSLAEAFGLSIVLLRVAGLFPYYMDKKLNKFRVSWKLMSLTVIHLLVYAYVNMSSIFKNWQDYSQPMLGNSPLMAIGNLILRLLGNLITFLILGILPLGVKTYACSLNQYLKIMEEFELLGIDVRCTYRRIYYFSCCISLVQAGVIIFNCWHSIYYYELITDIEPPFKYYLVVILSSFYKAIFIFFGCIQLYGVFLISSQLNEFLMDYVRKYQKNYEQEKLSKYFSFQVGKK